MTDLDLARLKQLADWLDRRGQPNSGIRYAGQNYDLNSGRLEFSRVELRGADADFIYANFHGDGARKMHAELAALIEAAEALVGVVKIADRNTDEFIRARTTLAALETK